MSWWLWCSFHASALSACLKVQPVAVFTGLPPSHPRAAANWTVAIAKWKLPLQMKTFPYKKSVICKHLKEHVGFPLRRVSMHWQRTVNISAPPKAHDRPLLQGSNRAWGSDHRGAHPSRFGKHWIKFLWKCRSPLLL